MFIAFSTTLGTIAFIATFICLSLILFPIFFAIIAMPRQQLRFVKFVKTITITSIINLVVTGSLTLLFWPLAWGICPLCLYLCFRLSRIGFYRSLLGHNSLPA